MHLDFGAAFWPLERSRVLQHISVEENKEPVNSAVVLTVDPSLFYFVAGEVKVLENLFKGAVLEDLVRLL
jgi:hypothetical protein